MNNFLLKQPTEKTSKDIYPMPAFCTLTVDDVQRSANWYGKILNFKVIFSMQHPASGKLIFAHLRREKYQDILLVEGKTEKEKNAYGISINFQAYCDIDSLTCKARKNGALIVLEPHDTPWNTRQVTLQDLNGYQINFTHIISEQRTMKKIVEAQTKKF